MNLEIVEHGGACPVCARRVRPLRIVTEYLSTVLSTSMATTTARAQLERWSTATIAERLLSELQPLYKDATRELKCLAGICGKGTDTWG